MRYDALTRAIYLQYRSLFDRTPAAVLALVLVGLTALVLVARGRARDARPRCGARAGAAPRAAVRLGRWRWPALACCCGSSSAPFLVLPGGVLVYWLARGLERPAPSCRGTRRSTRSRRVGARRRASRSPPRSRGAARARATRAAGRGCSSGSRTPATRCPGIVIALSLVFFAARYASPALPDARAARLRVRRALLPAGARGRRTALARVEPAPRGGLARARPRPARDDAGTSRCRSSAPARWRARRSSSCRR